MNRIILLTIISSLLLSCKSKKALYDASGSFEAIETIVSAEATGAIKEMRLEEGQRVEKGAIIGYIDTSQLYLKKKQLQAQVKAVLSKKPEINTQLAALQAQLQQAEREQRRVSNLVKADAATPKQLDDANSQVSILRGRVEAQQSSLEITSSGISEETLPLGVQISQIDDQLAKAKIINPSAGTVLAKYAEENEMTAVGKPLYKTANLEQIILRAYISGDQLSEIKAGQPVKVLVDDPDKKYKEYTGTITWISNKAEFTPKTIQTKDERANLVYAVKIMVKNDGYLKIGMYGEVKF